MWGKQWVAILVVGIVGMLQVRPQLFSTDYDENGSSSETSSALVLALDFPYSLVKSLLNFIRG